ncbi:response regulator [Sulfitobacter donghicola]|uniref:Response regulator n=1 Tax=Sulfitobacter donghicola DSW-25 = KCTC 12864 = JCM 14565 TaxID=1300350 RepID=A0A073IG79_9RHOB|nr:response regulator transcription factor [Sulfitobacter donghicola]KEJ88515.1 response regulator [Sulfitobacter donghicola DSW-25 = KCTC 12864 = JCM 14565]KIN69606.1 Response regulator [Sulfitobacter donghicola DSW-25 = KCTC 12864 = JCM 14565]
MKTVLIIEDHAGARQQITQVVDEAFSDPVIDGVATLSAARRHLDARLYDLVVLDLNLPDGSGDEFIVEILQTQPNAYVVISTIHDESSRLIKALENGAKGYLLKEQPKESLIEDFKGILEGKPPLAPAITRRLLEMMRERSIPVQDPPMKPAQSGKVIDEEGALLTEREKEVLVLLAKGFNRPEVGGFLNISKHTVATHISNIYSKLDVSSRSEAALVAQQYGLL